MTTYTANIVKQWALDTVFARKDDASKAVRNSFQTCALAMAYILVTQGPLMKKEDKWKKLSTNTKEQTATFISHNFNNVKGIPFWCDDAFVSSKKESKGKSEPWIVSETSETGWKRAIEDVRVMRNDLGPLWVKFLATHNAGKGGVLTTIPSGTALLELLEKWLRCVYAVEMKRKESIKDKKVPPEGAEVLGGSSAKVCENERDATEKGTTDDDDQDNAAEDTSSTSSSPSGDLTMSSIGSVSEDRDTSRETSSARKQKKFEYPATPPGWFFALIILWALLGPLSEEPADYMKVAGTSMTGAAGGKPTTLGSIREAAGNAVGNGVGDGGAVVPVPKSKKTSIEYQLEKKNQLMEKAVAASEATSDQIKKMGAEVALGATIKRKEMLIDILKRKKSEAADLVEAEEIGKKLRKAEDEYVELLSN